MAIIEFPPVECADENGLLAIGGDLELESLLNAYKSGIFPWPINEDYPLAWFSPDPRGILSFKDLHVPRSLQKKINQEKFEIKFNKCFEKVIKNCASVKNRKGQNDTWITQDIIKSYIELYQAGFAYSSEAYLEGKLVGGVYGVCIAGYASGESMFFTKRDASKVALVKLLEELNQHGINWLDTQMVTPVVKALGGKEISRTNFLQKLNHSLTKPQIHLS